MKIKGREKILPQIQLKYFGTDEQGKKPTHPNVRCFLCRKKNISIGSVMDAYSKHPKSICEDCAIDMFKHEHGYKSRQAAAARRRRMFDVSYLFQEMLIDEYMKRRNFTSTEDIPEGLMEELFNRGSTLYNKLYDKEAKIRIEEIEDQPEIEIEFKKAIFSLNL